MALIITRGLVNDGEFSTDIVLGGRDQISMLNFDTFVARRWIKMFVTPR